MKRINPTSFYGPRAYTTDLDYKIVRFKSDRKAYKREAERRLKIILLTKETVVCAASHLTHEFAYDLLNDNPVLLDETMIIPALRRDKEHVTDYLEGKRVRKSLRNVMRDFYENHVNRVVDWELIENTAWFRENLLKALKDEHSVIRRNIPDLPKENLDSLLSEIEKHEILTREIILESILVWPRKERRIFMNLVTLVYHMSGARVVNCESTLPQENYIDYSLSDFSKHRTALSDTQIFSKIFFELAFETLHKNALPVEILDVLSYEDINHLRKPIQKSSFRRKYDELIQKSIQAVKRPETDSENVMYDIDKPLELLEQISKTFDEIFNQELPDFLKGKGRETTKELQKSTLSLGIGVLGLIPVLSEIASGASLFQLSREFFVNLNQYFRNQREIDNYELYLKDKEKILRHLIEKYPISEKSVLLDTLDMLVTSISVKIQL